ncbi:MAG: LysE family transporter [Desulfobacterales bacterium]|jgi:threonine/homoserine/homoserine lactone efflux protein
MNASLMSGLLLGLAAGAAPGPLLALVVTQTLRFGTAEGLKVAAAPLITDLPIVLASIFLLSRLTARESVLGLISVAGGVYVCFLAWESFRTAPVELQPEAADPQSWRRGALVNFLNPHPYLFWMTVGGPLVLRAWRESPSAPVLFIFGFYGTLVGAKLAIALAAGRFRGFLSSSVYRTLVRVLGFLLAVFGLVLFWDGIVLFTQ